MKATTIYNLLRLLPLFVCLAFGGFLSACQPPPDENVALEIADCLGSGPSWEEIYTYFYSEAVRPGMTRDEVHAQLDCFGVWKVDLADGPDQGGMDSDTKQLVFREIIRFEQEDVKQVMEKWGFLYDINDHLVRFNMHES